MSVGAERIQVLEGVRIWLARKFNVRKAGVLIEVSRLEIKLITQRAPLLFKSRFWQHFVAGKKKDDGNRNLYVNNNPRS
ncbi:hypothetical protein BGZ60DRAFT_398894 [Tricladium varicosporioides]|nr:hypothetical protein BGZ60DRAFT_398894 [Hymenoscyphus varicosporioides]